MVSLVAVESLPRLIIIGGGMAGSRLAHDLMATEAGYQVTLISEEAQVGYNRIMLSALLAKEIDAKDMPLVDIQGMREKGLEVVAGDAAAKIDTHKRLVVLASGRELQYDKLVFATGSRASILPIDGSKASNVIGFRNWQDTQVLSELPSTAHVSVIGGGLLGLEAAVGLAKKGHPVTVYHRSGWILNRQLDEAAAKMLQAQLEKYGVTFRLGQTPEKFKCNAVGKVIAILGKDHIQPADLVVMAAGITPEIELAKAAGITTNKAIIVDAQLRTSHEDVYAIGECCEFESQTFGLVAPIWDQLKVLLKTLGKTPSVFTIEAVPTKLKVSGVNVFSVGRIVADGEDQEICYTDVATDHYRKLLINGDQLVGAILYGNVADGSWYFQLIQNKTNVSSMLDTLIFGEAYCSQDVA